MSCNILYFLNSWVVMELLSSCRKLAFTSRVGSERDTSNFFGRISQVMEVTCDWHARVATLAGQSYVYRYETRAVAPPDQGTTIVIDLWTTPTDLWWLTTDLPPVHDRPKVSQVMASKIRLTCESNDRLATNLWLFPQFSRVSSRVGPPTVYTWAWAVRSHQSEACLGHVIQCRSYVTPMSILCHSQVTRESLLNLLYPFYVTRQKLPLWRNFKSDLRLTYVRAEWHTSPRVTYDQFVRDLQPTYGPSPSWPLGKSFPTVLNRSIRSGNLCRAMASPPSYCECSGVAYDLLTSNIGGT